MNLIKNIKYAIENKTHIPHTDDKAIIVNCIDKHDILNLFASCTDKQYQAQVGVFEWDTQSIFGMELIESQHVMMGSYITLKDEKSAVDFVTSCKALGLQKTMSDFTGNFEVYDAR